MRTRLHDQRVRLRSGVYCATAPDGRVTLIHAGRRGERIGVLSAMQRAVLRTLAAGECRVPEVEAIGHDAGTLLRRLRAGGWLTVHHDLDDKRLITVRPLGPHRVPEPPAPPAAPVLSRFALLRRDGDVLVLESPLSPAVIEVHDPSVLTLLHQGAGPAAVGRPAVDLPEAVVAELTSVLSWYGFLAAAGAGGDLASAQWSPHELWLHSRSRAGHHEGPLGATGWAAGRFPPPPPRREPWSVPATAVPLRTPAGDALSRPFGEVLAGRRSIRHASGPLTVDRLGEFLHWAARVRPAEPLDDPDVSRRPSPSGGARHAIEVYPVVTEVDGLAAGLYHYDPYGHCLQPVPAPVDVVRQLATRAAEAAGGAPTPQVLLVLAARFGRTMWKYQGMAYALLLKDAGALMQTMYLVATAMGLAPCALGSGDVELFAAATGLDKLVESSVGEFILSA